MTLMFVAPDVTMQIPLLNTWLNSSVNGLVSVAGSVMTPDAPEPGVPEHAAATTLNSLMVATPVSTTMRRRIPAVPFTLAVTAAMMFVLEEPAQTGRPEVSVRSARRLTPSDPPINALTGGTALPAGPVKGGDESRLWPARRAAVTVPLGSHARM